MKSIIKPLYLQELDKLYILTEQNMAYLLPSTKVRVCSVGVIRWNVMERFYTLHPSVCSVREKKGMERFLGMEYSVQIRNQAIPPIRWNVPVPFALIALSLRKQCKQVAQF
jgi:hypothetical protein